MDKNLRHSLLVLSHGEIKHLIRLVKYFDRDFRIYVHIDKRYPLTTDDLTDLINAHPNIKVFSKYKVFWGGRSILAAEMFLLERIAEDGGTDYVHLLSGLDYPIKPLSEFKTFFKEHNGYEFLEWHRFPVEKWEGGTYRRLELFRLNDYLSYRSPKGKRIIDKFNAWQIRLGIKRRVPQHYPVLYGGSNWMSITYGCACHVLDCHKRKRKFYRRLKFTFAPDEIYLHTLIMNSPYASHVINNNYRLITWDNMGNGPLVLGHKDWWNITVSSALIMRKVDPLSSETLLSRIDKYLLVEDGPKISANGSWIHASFRGHSYDSSLASRIVDLCSILFIRTIYDFGCGVGWYVKYLRDKGLDVQGYDGNKSVEEVSSLFFEDGFYCQMADLSEPVIAEDQADMVMSIEVGEHIPPESESIFLDNLTRNSGKYVLLSWALPDQKGDGHVNCQSNKYIIREMKCRGFRINVPISIMLRRDAYLPWLRGTLMFFEKDNGNGLEES